MTREGLRQAEVCICNLHELPAHADSVRPSHLVSLVPSDEQPPTPRGVEPARHLRLELDDIEEAIPGYVLPDQGHVERLIDFAAGWDGDRPMLLHCQAGISRSMAAALITVCVKSEIEERQAAASLRRAAPHAQPNRRIVFLADKLLGRDGRIMSAVQDMGPAKAAFRGPLVRLPFPLHVST